MQPNIPQEACSLIKERDKIKYTNPHSPQIPELNHEIGRLIAEHKRNKWREHLTKCNFGTKTLWNTVKKLNNNIVEANNIKIDFGIKTAEDNKTAATLFNHLFNPKLKSSKGNKRRILLRKLKSKKQSENLENFEITVEQVNAAIKGCKSSTALGPDEISPIMMKKLGPLARSYLTDLFNLVLRHNRIPNNWKKAIVVPLLKPGKPPGLGTSYRPVSLLSPLAKTLERTLLSYLVEAFDLKTHQHGF